MEKIGIYKIQSIRCKDRFYIGSAVKIKSRWSQHIHYLRKNKHHAVKLQRHYNKYGESDLQFAILLCCDKEDLLKVEQYFIDFYKPYFNSSKIAGSNLGMKVLDTTKHKLSAKRGINHYNYGKHMSDEVKQKISQKTKGINHYNYGKKHSEETRRKISIGKTGGTRTPITEQTREKMRMAKIGKKSPMLGRKLTDEHKNRLRISLIKYYHKL